MASLRIGDIEWDAGNVLHLELNHGIRPEEAEDVFAGEPRVRKTKKGHYKAFGRTSAGRLLVIVFEMKPKQTARPITGWDMDSAEAGYYRNMKGK